MAAGQFAQSLWPHRLAKVTRLFVEPGDPAPDLIRGLWAGRGLWGSGWLREETGGRGGLWGAGQIGAMHFLGAGWGR